MILDSLENSKRIECIHPLFKQAFDGCAACYDG